MRIRPSSAASSRSARPSSAKARPTSARAGVEGAGGGVFQDHGHGQGQGIGEEEEVVAVGDEQEDFQEDEREEALLSMGVHETISDAWISSQTDSLMREQQARSKDEEEENRGREEGDGEEDMQRREKGDAAIASIIAQDAPPAGAAAARDSGFSQEEEEDDEHGAEDLGIIEDDDDDDDGDGFDEWGELEAGFGGSSSGAHQAMRPASAVMRGRPPSAHRGGAGSSSSPAAGASISSLGMWGVFGGDGEEGVPRLEPLTLPLIEIVRPAASRLATGNVARLVHFVDVGKPMLCIDGLESAARTINRARGGDAAAMADMAGRLVVVGLFCGLRMMQVGSLEYAKQIMKTVQLLTGGYTRPYKHKPFLRVWVLVAHAELCTRMGMPGVAFEYVETAVDTAEASGGGAGRLVCMVSRASLFIRACEFDKALADAECAKRTMARMERAGELSTSFRPFLKSCATIIGVCIAYARAVSLLCREAPRVSEAGDAAREAWSRARELAEGSALGTEARSFALRVRDLLTSEGDGCDALIAAVRDATRVPHDGFAVSSVRDGSRAVGISGGVGGGGRAVSRPVSAASVRSRDQTELMSAVGGGGRGGSRQGSGMGLRGGGTRPPSATGREGREAKELLLAVVEATIRQGIENEGKEHQEAQGEASEGAQRHEGVQIEEAVAALREAMKGVGLEEEEEEEEVLDAGAGEEDGIDAGVVSAVVRHMRGSWLRYSPVIQMTVSRALADFLVMIGALFARGRDAEIVAQVEKLMKGIRLPGVEDALGDSKERDVCIAIAAECTDMACIRFTSSSSSSLASKSEAGVTSIDDAMVLFGVALSLTQKEGMEGPGTLLRAWILDQVAYCHYLKGEYMACRSLIASALSLCDTSGASEGGEGESRVRGGLSMGEMRVVLLSHAVESELKMGRSVAALDLSLTLLTTHLRNGSPLLFKRPPTPPPAGPLAAAARTQKQQSQQMHRGDIIGIYEGEDDIASGSRFGSDVSLCTPRLQASISATPKWEGHRPQNQGGEGGAICHSLRYVTADVAFSTAAASARLGKFTDALSLLKFAEINGARAKDATRGRRGGLAWDGEQSSDSLKRRVKEGVELLEYVIRENAAPDTSLFSAILSHEGDELGEDGGMSGEARGGMRPGSGDGGDGGRGGMPWRESLAGSAKLMRPGGVYRAMYQALSETAKLSSSSSTSSKQGRMFASASTNGRSSSTARIRPASATAALRRQIFNAGPLENPLSAPLRVKRRPASAAASRSSRPASAAASRIRPASAQVDSERETLGGGGWGRGTGRPSSALGIGGIGSTEGVGGSGGDSWGGVKDGMRVASSVYGGSRSRLLRPVSAMT